MTTIDDRPGMKIETHTTYVWITAGFVGEGAPNSDEEEALRCDTARFHRDQTAELIRALIVESPPRREEIPALIEQLQTLLYAVVCKDAAPLPAKKLEPLAPKLNKPTKN